MCERWWDLFWRTCCFGFLFGCFGCCILPYPFFFFCMYALVRFPENQSPSFYRQGAYTTAVSRAYRLIVCGLSSLSKLVNRVRTHTDACDTLDS